jgi:hypothetical protein
MKVEIAVIKLVLRTNKTLADGTSPIMLRVSFNGMKEKATGYSCLPKFWDKKNECVKKGFPNFVMVNSELKRLKDEAIARRDKFVASNEVYTPSMILTRETFRNAVTNDFYGLVERYLAERDLTSNGLGAWHNARKALKDFTKTSQLLVNEINIAFCKKFCKYLEEKGLSSSSIRLYASKIVVIMRFAHKLKLIDSYPLDDWSYRKSYHDEKREGYIHYKTMEFMMQNFINEIIIRTNDKRFTYREGAIEELLNVKSELYAKYLYLIGYYLCGLAPVDISLLKKTDLKTITVNGVDYYAIDGRRSKTGAQYKIRVPKNTIESAVLINTMVIFNGGEYFLPTLNGYVGNKLDNRLSKVYDRKRLLPWFKSINSLIAQNNAENESEQLNFIDLDLKFYSYRHTFIMSELQKPNCNLLRLATMTGKSLITLHQYAELLSDLELV